MAVKLSVILSIVAGLSTISKRADERVRKRPRKSPELLALVTLLALLQILAAAPTLAQSEPTTLNLYGLTLPCQSCGISKSGNCLAPAVNKNLQPMSCLELVEIKLRQVKDLYSLESPGEIPRARELMSFLGKDGFPANIQVLAMEVLLRTKGGPEVFTEKLSFFSIAMTTSFPSFLIKISSPLNN